MTVGERFGLGRLKIPHLSPRSDDHHTDNMRAVQQWVDQRVFAEPPRIITFDEALPVAAVGDPVIEVGTFVVHGNVKEIVSLNVSLTVDTPGATAIDDIGFGFAFDPAADAEFGAGVTVRIGGTAQGTVATGAYMWETTREVTITAFVDSILGADPSTIVRFAGFFTAQPSVDQPYTAR